MKDSTLGTVYALKHGNKELDEVVIDYWSELTGTPAKYYGKEILMDIAIDVLRDYISTADNPSFVLWELFNYMHFDCKSLYKVEKEFDDRVRDAIWTTLVMTQVRDNEKYVNGFRELEEEK